MRTTELCPGSVPENKHYLVEISPYTGNRMCDNTKCYFAVKYKDGTGTWQTGFDPNKATSFIKNTEDIPKIEEQIEL